MGKSAARGTMIILATWLAAPAHPQTVPGAVQPGQIERQFQPPPEPASRPATIELPTPTQTPPANAEALRFTLTAIVVEGVSVYEPALFRSEYQDSIGQEVSLADIYDIANRLTARYRNDGYVLSQVVVPAQSVKGGTVRLQAVEGYVHEVRFEGGAAPARALPDRYAAGIKATRPLTAGALERYLLLMNDLAGTTAKATLIPSPGHSGASDLVVQWSHRRIDGSMHVDNRGTESLGPWRLTAEIGINDLLGRHDRSTVRFATTANRELDLVSLSHEQPVGEEGSKIAVGVSAVEARPGLGETFPATLETSSRSASAAYTHPLIRSRSRNLYLRGALTAHDGETEIDGVRSSRDRIRALRLGATFDYADRLRGINLVDLEFSQGLEALGASRNEAPDLSRAGGNADFAKLTLYAARLQSLASRWSLLAALSAQYAFSDLLAPELFAFGGEAFGRGYDPSELVGDSGAAAKLELRYSGAAFGPLSGYTAYAFYDVGTVRRRTPQDEAATESAASAGLGLRLAMGRSFDGYLELAKPLTHIVAAEGDRDWRAYVGLAARF